MMEEVKVFIGTDVSQLGAAEVLRQSILETSSVPVHVETMERVHIPQPKDVRQSQRTGFSFSRWVIPELCDYKGRAIYIDADMMVFTDIKELWDWDMQGGTIAIVDGRDTSYCADWAKGNKNETSVMVIDCAKAKWSLASLVEGLDGQYDYKQMMSDLCFMDESEICRTIPRRWNAMDFWDKSVSLLHYTNVPTQPWVTVGNPYGHVWVNNLKRLISQGKIDSGFIRKQIELGYFRPSLQKELEGETCLDPESDYGQALFRLDRDSGYLPHRDLMVFTRKRDLAIRSYQLTQAKETNIKEYLKLRAQYAVNDLKYVAKRVLKRA
ncbi:MAG: glycosyltransferase [Micavibrio sp.]